MRNLLLLSLLFFNFTKGYNQESTTNYQDATKLINVWLEAQKDYQDIPAIMGVAVKDQKIVWSGAFGKSNREENINANTNTIASIGSISKLFTATAIMKLVSENKLRLDSNIKDLLPNYHLKEVYQDSGSVTVASLLTHSSGVPRDTDHSYWSGPNHAFPSKTEMFDHLNQMETNFAVGSNVQYSNVGFALLGQVIEEVSGISYKEYMETEIFKHLGMTNSVVEMQELTYGKEHAIGYTAMNRDRKRKKANFFQTKAMQPAAGISSSVEDLAKFASWQFRLMDSTESELLTPEALKSMYDIHATSRNGYMKRGYGFEIQTDKEGNKWVMHGGMCPGYVAFLKMDLTNKMAYAILINTNGERALKYVNGIIHILNKAGSSIPTQTAIKNLSDYSGFFDLNPWNGEYYIGPWNNGLVAFYLPTESLQYAMYFYQHQNDDVFELVNENNEPTGEELIFYRDDKGIVTKVKNDGQMHYPKKE